MKELKEIRRALGVLAEREAIKLWRLAREAQKRGLSEELVNEIREEGWLCHGMRDDPDRMMNWKFEYEVKYAFKLGGN